MLRRIFSFILILGLILIPFSADAAVKKKAKKTVRAVEIQTPDEIILTGTLTIPEAAGVKNKVPLVILMHSLGSNKTIYTKLANDLKEKNIASFALDVRGHHQSTTKLNGKKTYWQNYTEKTFSKYPDDIKTVVSFLNEHYVALDTNRLGILGADISANTAIIAANKNQNITKSLVLFSPTMEFKGLKTPQALMNYGNHPVMIIVTQGDVYHYKEAVLLEKYAEGETKFITTKTGGTGDTILKLNPYLNNIIVDWFLKYL